LGSIFRPKPMIFSRRRRPPHPLWILLVLLAGSLVADYIVTGAPKHGPAASIGKDGDEISTHADPLGPAARDALPTHS
jgi:hypothetical protein